MAFIDKLSVKLVLICRKPFELFLGSTKGYYLFIETSSPRKVNDTARISSVVFRSSLANDNCKLRFWYHMYGNDVDTLNVHLRTSVNGPLRNIWNMTGDLLMIILLADLLLACRPFSAGDLRGLG